MQLRLDFGLRVTILLKSRRFQAPDSGPGNDFKLKKGKSTNGSVSKSWSFSDPDIKRRRAQGARKWYKENMFYISGHGHAWTDSLGCLEFFRPVDTPSMVTCIAVEAILILEKLQPKGCLRFSDIQGFEKHNDEQALKLMNSCAVDVLEEFKDIVFAYGVSDEHRHYGVKPILVFDGGYLPMKNEQEIERARSRKENLARAIEHESCGDTSAAYEYYQKAVDIPPTIAYV
ncbi:hypothetical protein L2E82_25445 [Cichorium intybus]|uniref:Uncharacterized protein n=1 Tax=Cichorium intybus TaxID=13427 RepID=A0ACB9E497_CICIN|nr:hypothetical protein L2E82_25445 [Cichorium intybus]